MADNGLVLKLDENSIEHLADAIAARLRIDRQHEHDQDRWMTTEEAAKYLGRSVSAMHKLTASRQIDFEQEGPGCRCYFKKSALDAWMQS